MFTLAHLSDPHLTSLQGVRPAALANKRILGYLSWLRRRRYVHRPEVLRELIADLKGAAPDHIAVTGDLTHVGLPAECRVALQWLNDLGPADSVSVVPGNHDRYVTAPHASTVGLWQSFWRDDAGREGFPCLRQRGPVALIGVDTAVATAPFVASGLVGEAQRKRLGVVLRQTHAAGLFRVVALHHSPLISGHSARKRLRDAASLTDLLCEAGAELVIHGHGHEERIDRLTTAHGPMCVVAVPSASHSGPGRAGWNRYEITGESGQWRLRITARRSASEGFVTAGEEVVQWGSLSPADVPRFR